MIPRTVLAGLAVAAAMAPPSASAATALNVVPHGQQGPGVPWATTPGILPADTQARMYDRLTPLFRDITDDVLRASDDGTGYFKSADLLAADDPRLITDETVTGTAPGVGPVSARVRRDAYGVPHIYSDTDAGAIFAAGSVVATDQGLLLDQARRNGVAGLIDLPGVPAIELVLGLYDYRPSAAVLKEETDRQTKAIEAAGTQGRQLLADIDVYVAGINARNAALGKPADFTRTDIYALNAIKAQFLGEGGGQEVENALFLDALRGRLGATRGDAAFTDLRARNDPETSTTTGAAPATRQSTPRLSRPRGLVRLKAGTFRSAEIRLPGAAGRASAATAPRPSERQKASNILIASGARSATGAPLFVGGPQIGYNYPGLTYEVQIKSPSIDVRGVSSAPFPGYMLIGRGAGYGWTLTSAGADIIDTYAERLCGGSTRKYVFNGRCRAMERVDAGTIAKGGKTVRVRFDRTVHGPVVGYATDRRTGRTVALTRKRTSRGQETVDQLFHQQMTFGRVANASDFARAAARTPQTFNAFYASGREASFYTAGALPRRRAGVNGDLPTDGTGRYEWSGLLPGSAHPRAANPSNGLIVNWNNKPARDFPAGDDRFGSEGGPQRVDLLLGELARTPKATLAQVLGAANAGATQDVRIMEFWPTLKAVLARGTSPSARATAAVAALDRWRAAGGSRADRDGNGTIDDPGAGVLDAAWRGITDAGLCDRLGKAGCTALERRIGRYDAPPGGQYGGWHQYMDKDLRTLLGRKVQGRYGVRYCGNGDVKRCARKLWAALDRPAPAAPTKAATITFSPLPLVTMQYTNRPSGIHQVLTFGP